MALFAGTSQFGVVVFGGWSSKGLGADRSGAESGGERGHASEMVQGKQGKRESKAGRDSG